MCRRRNDGISRCNHQHNGDHDQKRRAGAPVHNPLFCIVPPYILEEIVQRGNATQRTAAVKALGTGNTVRNLRMMQPRQPGGQQKYMGLMAMEGVKPTVQRTIFDAHSTENLPGDVVRSEGNPATGDPAVDEAYDGLGATFDFYLDVFGRNSIDDMGMPLNATVHFGQNVDNAFFDGQRMLFGDGTLFNRFTVSLDVIGHELTHGVVQDESQLLYLNQSGALNESCSDIFGIMVKQKLLKQDVKKSNWLIGEELFKGTKLKGKALRSMADPGTAFNDPVLGKDPQPKHMKKFVRTLSDHGGVHINSGIPNHAFYLLATDLGGNAWDRAGRIWYETLRDTRIRPISGFQAWARRTVANAGLLYGDNSNERNAVIKAWKQVGIDVP